MGKFDKTEQQFAAEAFKRRFPLEKAWSDAAREASVETRASNAKGKQKGPHQIVYARAEKTGLKETGRMVTRDRNLHPEVVPDWEGKAGMWLNHGHDEDVARANDSLKGEGYTIFRYPQSEKDPLGRARNEVVSAARASETKKVFPLEQSLAKAKDALGHGSDARGVEEAKGKQKGPHQDVQAHDKPLAAAGLKSYRLKGPYGYVMIGAKDHDDAMREAARSTASPKRENLEMWDTGDKKYKPVEKAWSDAAREASAEARAATHHLKEGYGAQVGQDFTRASKDIPVTHIEDVPGGKAKVRLHEGRFAGQTAIVPKGGLKAIETK